MNLPGFAPHQLRLKVGIPVILLRNINPAQGLANGPEGAPQGSGAQHHELVAKVIGADR